MTGLVPVAVGCTVLADPLVHLVLPVGLRRCRHAAGAGYLAAPLLILAYLYQTTLIALNRESVGVRTLVAGAIGIVPLVALLRLTFRAARGVAGGDRDRPGSRVDRVTDAWRAKDVSRPGIITWPVRCWPRWR